jgi:hypothetical protein
MLNLVGANEFGDWLLEEISETTVLSHSADTGLSHLARHRLNTLQVAKGVLLRFLILQQAMLDAASEARAPR